MDVSGDLEASRAKGRMDAGRRRARRERRPYFCRMCGARVDAEFIPKDWFSLSRHMGNDAEKAHRLGLYCSLACLDKRMPILRGIDTNLGENWALFTQQYRQR